MSITWPITLPQALDADGLTITNPDNTIKQNMDVGPPKTRMRDSSAPYKITGKITMTVAQYILFDEFYNETLRYGSLSFGWKHPYTLAEVTMRFSSVPKTEDAEGAISITMSLEMRK